MFVLKENEKAPSALRAPRRPLTWLFLAVFSFGGCPRPEAGSDRSNLPDTSAEPVEALVPAPPADSGVASSAPPGSNTAASRRVIVLGGDVGVSMAPAGGPVEGGTAVTFLSREGGFDERTSVLFGEHAAESVRVDSPYTLVATAPSGDPGVVDIILSAPGFMPVVSPLIIAGTFEYYIMPPDDGSDSDGDGLSDFAELTGWEVWVDAFGLGLGVDTFGNVVRYTVISDPARSDTDGDGLGDLQEYLNRADPRNADTDGDGLGDHEELVRWKTSPVSMDTDGDSRGPDGQLAPNPRLFDGAELVTEELRGTGTAPFFSEYVEGSDYNQALEIYNPTDQLIDLDAEGYRIYVVGPGELLHSVFLSGQIQPLGVYVVADPRGEASLVQRADYAAELDINGSNVIILSHPQLGNVDVIGSAAGPQEGALFVDQQNQAAESGLRPLSEPIWQSFTTGTAGLFKRIEFQLTNDAMVSAELTAELRVGTGADDFLLGTAVGTLPAGQTQYLSFNFEAVNAHPGDVFTVVVRSDNPAAGVRASFAKGDPYSGGRADISAGTDYRFRTWLASYNGWGDAGVSTVDHTLRRQARACGGDTQDQDAFNPRTDWVALPIDTFDGLGMHNTNCPKWRVISGGTSPTLSDTDGDGRSDYEEFDDPLRSSQCADVPRLRLNVDGDIDVRLLVTYSDSMGTSSTYGTSVSESRSSSSGSTESGTVESSTTLNTHITAEVGITLPPKVTLGAEFEVGGSNGASRTFEVSTESAQSAEAAYSEERSNSRERSEESSTGSISVGLVVENVGDVAFELADLAVTVRQFIPAPGAATPANPRPGSYRTVTTLTPAIDGVTLAPGDRSPVIQVSNNDVNGEIIRQFLANPTTLLLEAAGYELLNGDGLNFDFATATRSRTAEIVIDYGDPDMPSERYLVATNVDRGPDGEFAGVPLTRALEQAIGLRRAHCGDLGQFNAFSYVLEPQRLAHQPVCGGSGELTLTHIRGFGPQTIPNSFWVIVKHALDEASNENGPLNTPFEQLVLKPGDEILLYLTRDDDGDGLFQHDEIAFGTSDQLVDTDGDGLSDAVELHGWSVQVFGQEARRITSDPRNIDTDFDGLTDLQEYLGVDGLAPHHPQDEHDATDPRDADTDMDSLSDSLDALPLVPAKRLYVSPNGNNGGGLTWENAYTQLAAAIKNAAERNAHLPPWDEDDEVSEIWVAAGVYRPDRGGIFPFGDREAFFFPLPDVKIYGGFAGGEAKLADRNPDPMTNGTILSGDLLGNDSGLLSAISTTHPSRQDNSYTVVRAFTNIPSNENSLLDGFTVRSGNANGPDPGEDAQVGGVMVRVGELRLRNLMIAYNTSRFGSAGMLIRPVGGGTCSLESCRFIQNLGSTSDADNGGGLLVGEGSTVYVRNCDFSDNVGDSGAGMRIEPGAHAVIEGCTFNRNTGRSGGGAISNEGRLDAFGCRFRNNSGANSGAINSSGDAVVTTCEFWGNSAGINGSAIWVRDGAISLTNVTVGGNRTTSNCSGVIGESPAAVLVSGGQLSAFNLVLWGNTAVCGSFTLEQQQLHNVGSGFIDVRSSIIQGLNAFAGNANLAGDPLFRDLDIGDLRLTAGSSAIDTGGFVLDIDPFTAGFQPLPMLDVIGQSRVSDGNNDGEGVMDRGAFEYSGAN